MSEMSAPKKYDGAGIILIRKTSEGSQFLLLRGLKTGIWSFPKGHPEDRDGGIPLNTAIREVYEETGYRAGYDYTIVSDRFRLGKRHYWIAIMNTDATWIPRISASEHSTSGWFRLRDFTNLIANACVRAFVKRVQLIPEGRGNIPVMETYSTAIIAS